MLGQMLEKIESMQAEIQQLKERVHALSSSS